MEKKRPRDELTSHTADIHHAKRRSRPSAALQPHQKPIKLWLDIPPSEIRVRIARMLCFGRPNRDALQLAHTSSIQTQAVLEALSFTLQVSGDVIPDLYSWTSAFGDRLRHISIGHIGVFRPEIRACLLKLLKSPALRRAEVFDDAEVLKSLAESKSVQELVVRISTTDAQRVLLHTIKSLNLEKLELYSYCRFARECPFNVVTDDPSRIHELPECCPRVTSLRISCSLSQHTHNHQNDPVWRLIPLFPNLREVTVETDAPDNILSSLKRLDSVHVTSRLLWGVDKPDGASAHALRLAVSLGSVVTHLTTPEVLRASQTGQLVRCASLRRLEIRIKEGEDHSLVTCIGSLPLLEHLSLQWFADYHGSLMARDLPDRYCACTPGVIAGIARLATKLRELELIDVKIEMSELTEVLSCLGRGLRHVRTPIINQDEEACVRLLDLMRCVTKHCTGLCSWGVDIGVLTRTYPLNAWFDGSVHRHEEPIRVALRRLKRSVPFLDTSEFEQQFNDIFGSGADVPR